MVENVSVILHWNTDYAEFPRSEFPTVVQTSFEPIVSAIEDWKDGKICFNITGHTFEYLQKNNPELLDRIKVLVKDDIVEMIASGYSHPILPLLPRPRVEIQLKDHISLLKKLFKKTPTGIWPPELAVSPSVLSQIKKQGIEWTAIDYEHFLLSQYFGNDMNPFERRDLSATEIFVDAYWAKGLKKLRAYLKALRTIKEVQKTQDQPVQRVIINDKETIKAFLCSVCWTYSTQFAVGGDIAFYNLKKHLKAINKSNSKHLNIYGSDIEFFGYRSMGPEAAKPVDLINFLRILKKQGINTKSPSDIPEEEWPEEASYLSAGCWSPDKSFRIWTDSEDNTEYIRRANEIYDILSRLGWKKDLMTKLEPYLRIMENSDPRGWAPIPERKNEAYSAMASIFEILEK